MSVKIFPPDLAKTTRAGLMADLLAGTDWAAVSDADRYTGRVLRELIGPSFDPYRSLRTMADVAANASAKALVIGSQSTLDIVRTSGTGARYFLPAIGEPLLGGFFAGYMDSTQAGAIPANDQSQTGQRYALIDLGIGRESPAIQYKTTNDAAPLATNTVWDGLKATQAMIAAGAAYPAAQFAASVKLPDDGASPAYIPAMRELLAMYWAFKPMTANNYLTAETGSTFPGGTVTQGLNPTSDPTRPAFTTTVPAQTTLAAWKTGGPQAFADAYYWTATEYSATTAWLLGFGTSSPGRLFNYGKSNYFRLRLVRRLAL